MALTNSQKEAAQAIIAVFETGKLPSIKGYGTVTLLKGDSGGLTYGIHQTTINSGNLYLLIKDYAENPSAKFGDDFRDYLKPLLAKSGGLATNENFKALLRKAALDDVVMRETQDRFFDRVYWDKAVYIATDMGIKTALGTAVIYDSVIHGSWAKLRDRTITEKGSVLSLGEFAWIKAYNEIRRTWLATNANPLLRKCVYRQDAFRTLISGADWSLRLPMVLRSNGGSFSLTEDALGIRHADIDLTPAAPDPVRETPSAESDDDKVRLLFLDTPLMTGEDVRAMQIALNVKGKYGLNPDGEFGGKTDKAVRSFQQKMGLKADGICGPVTRTRLGL